MGGQRSFWGLFGVRNTTAFLLDTSFKLQKVTLHWVVTLSRLFFLVAPLTILWFLSMSLSDLEFTAIVFLFTQFLSLSFFFFFHFFNSLQDGLECTFGGLWQFATLWYSSSAFINQYIENWLVFLKICYRYQLMSSLIIHDYSSTWFIQSSLCVVFFHSIRM